jgi:hypothetical protein
VFIPGIEICQHRPRDMMGVIGEKFVISSNQIVHIEEERFPAAVRRIVKTCHLLHHAAECLVIGGDHAPHQFRSTQGAIGLLMMIEASSARINMQNLGVCIWRTVIQGAAGWHKDKVGVLQTAHAHQYPDGDQTVKIGGKMTNNSCWRLLETAQKLLLFLAFLYPLSFQV